MNPQVSSLGKNGPHYVARAGDQGVEPYDTSKQRESLRLMTFKDDNDPKMSKPQARQSQTKAPMNMHLVHDKEKEEVLARAIDRQREIFIDPYAKGARKGSMDRNFFRGSEGAIPTGGDRKSRDSSVEQYKYPLKNKERKPSGNLTGYVKPTKGRERGASDTWKKRIVEKPLREEGVDTADGSHRPKYQLFATSLDHPTRQMKGAYSQLTMDERVRALSLLKKHGLFPTALKLDKLPKPIEEETGIAPTQDNLDEISVFEVVKSVVEGLPSTGKKLSIDVPPGSVGAVIPPGAKPPAPTPEEREYEKRYKPPGTVEPKGVVPICDELHPCVKPEPCELKPTPKDLSKELSPSQMEAHNYLSKKRIFEFFQFMICHLLAEQPDDPVAFLGNLLDKCMMFRSGFSDPPLLFTEKHVNSVYHAMDPDEKGYITRKQYETAMRTMSVSNYNGSPEMDENGYISKEYFVTETVRALTENLNEMLKVGEVEPWRFLDKWFIPTAKVRSGKERDSDVTAPTRGSSAPTSTYRPASIVGASGRNSILGRNVQQPPAVGMMPKGGVSPPTMNALSRFGPGTVLQSMLTTHRPPLEQSGSKRESVVGKPTQAKSLRDESVTPGRSHMHEGPTVD